MRVPVADVAHQRRLGRRRGRRPAEPLAELLVGEHRRELVEVLGPRAQQLEPLGLEPIGSARLAARRAASAVAERRADGAPDRAVELDVLGASTYARGSAASRPS